MANITGNTRVFAILADPVHQVRTPQMLNRRFEESGVDAVLVPMHVGPSELTRVVESFRFVRNFGGFIVTVPHKSSMAGLCDQLGATALACGCVNTVRRTEDGRLVGDVFDGTGFVEGLQAQGVGLEGARVLLLGAGGAAAAIALAIAQAGVARLAIANRTAERAEALVVRTREHVPEVDVKVGDGDPKGFDVVVNATSLGMREGDPLPLDVARLDPSTLVADVIMKPEMTPLLTAAAARGCPIHLGHHMLQSQVTLMTQFLLGDGD